MAGTGQVSIVSVNQEDVSSTARITVTIETGEMARQADGAVVVSMADTVVLVTAVARKEADPKKDFFPLTVNYIEKTYAAGRIPGGFFKREGRPTEKETLTSRLIDRPIRPLFPEGFFNEVQVVATVISLNPDVDSDIPALLGASAALILAGVPFRGPIGAAKVGYKDGQYILNPTATQLKESKLELVVAGTREARADGRVGGGQPVRGRDARRRDVRSPADADGDQGDQRAQGPGRQDRLDLAARCGRTRSSKRRSPRTPKPRCRTHTRSPTSWRGATGFSEDQGSGGRRRLPAAMRRAFDARSRGDRIRQPRIPHRPPAHSRRRAAHRRPRHQDRAPDLDPRPACCRVRTARRCSRAARRRRWS